MWQFEAHFGKEPNKCAKESVRLWKTRREAWFKGQMAMRERMLEKLRSQEWETMSGSAIIQGLIKQLEEMEVA